MRHLFIFLCFAAFYGCATTEQSEEPLTELEEIPLEEEQTPSWFSTGKLGEVAEGHLTGYASAVGAETDWVVDNAARQARINLRSWIDGQIEEARKLVAESDERGDDREFITVLRNSVVELDFSGVEQEQEIIKNGSIRALVKIQAPAQEVLERIGRKMYSHRELWNKLKAAPPLQSWEKP